MVFIRFPFDKKSKYVFPDDLVVDSSQIQSFISSYLHGKDFKIYCNGKELFGGQEVFHDATVHVTFSLPGGKGGFGSMLRAIGAQIEKTTNREACRDLSGRRLRDINEEQRLKKWIAKESEREEEKLRRRKERIERLKAKPRHNFVDFEYEKVISQLPERIDDALTAGMQKVSKRPIEAGESSKAPSSKKKKSLWLEDMSDSSESDADSSEKPSSSKDTDCSNTSTQNDNISDSLASEASGGELSNSSTNCEKPPELKPDTAHDLVVQMEAKEASTSGDDSSSANITPSTSLPFQEEKPNDISIKETSVPETPNIPEAKNEEDDLPVDPLLFNNPTELEALGLNRLKAALMARGLKCGGNISDRAQRLWKVRGLEPHEFPSNLLAKVKK